MKHKPPNTAFSQKRIPLIIITIMLSNLLASCTSLQDSIFEGLFSTSFEVSVFYPCDTEYVEGVYNKDLEYWLTSTSDSGFNEQLKTFHSLIEPTGQLKMYVQFVGRISPTKQNGYGHLGMYSNQITVTEILDMKPWVDTLCQSE